MTSDGANNPNSSSSSSNGGSNDDGRTPNGMTDLLDNVVSDTNALAGANDNGDASVEDDGRGHHGNNAVELSKRADNLMNNFKNYVADNNDHETGEGRSISVDNGADGVGGGDVEKGRLLSTSSNNIKDSIDGSILSQYNDFTIEEYGGDFDDMIAQEYNRSRSPGGSHRYTHACFRSKRVKRGISMILLATVMIGIIVGTRKVKKYQSLPDWNKELEDDKNMLEYVKEAHEGDSENDQQYEQIYVDSPSANLPAIAVPIKSESSHKTAAQEILSQLLNSNNEDTQHQISFSSNNVEIAQRYSPIWFSRADGYDGTTYQQALLFCAHESMMIPCPYEAYCPNGEETEPYGGYMNSYGANNNQMYQWAPIIDGEGMWVQVGLQLGHGGDTPSCVTSKNVPEWGADGENGDETQFVLCCKSGMLDEDFDTDYEDLSTTTWTSSTTTSETSTSTTPTADLDEVNEDDSGPSNDIDEKEENTGNAFWLPKWYNRDDGWDGQTQEEAFEFCSSVKINDDGHQNDGRGNNNNVYQALCPYKVICPEGPDSTPFQGPVAASKSWAPSIDSYNSWVQVGDVDGWKCHNQGGFSGQTTNKEPTQFVLCCNTNKPAVMPQKPELKIEVEFNKTIASYPIWYDRQSGWLGQTYSEAVQFCANIEHSNEHSNPQRQHGLCPYRVYCKYGQSSTPYGGATVSVTWAPISNMHNNWVQLADIADENYNYDMCNTYINLNGVAPEWGVTGEGSEQITRRILCCSIEPMMQAINEEEKETRRTAPPTQSPQSTASDVEQIWDAYLEALHDKYQPIWHDLLSGWNGKNYHDATEFCSSKGTKSNPHGLCPYEVYCPNGRGGLPYGGGIGLHHIVHDIDVPDDGRNSWAPISDSLDGYVQIGLYGDHLCHRYDNMNPPLDRPGEEKLIGDVSHLLCCRDQDATLSATNGVQVQEEGWTEATVMSAKGAAATTVAATTTP